MHFLNNKKKSLFRDYLETYLGDLELIALSFGRKEDKPVWIVTFENPRGSIQTIHVVLKDEDLFSKETAEDVAVRIKKQVAHKGTQNEESSLNRKLRERLESDANIGLDLSPGNDDIKDMLVAYDKLERSFNELKRKVTELEAERDFLENIVETAAMVTDHSGDFQNPDGCLDALREEVAEYRANKK